MDIHIDVDDELLAEAMKLNGAKTSREVVGVALRELVRRQRQRRILEPDS